MGPRPRLRRFALFVVLVITIAACTSAGTEDVPEAVSETTTTDGGDGTTSSTTPQSSSTTGATTASTTTSTTAVEPQPRRYAVVAEERERAISVINPSCVDPACPPIARITLTERPHNLAAIGSVVYATHPSTGSVARIDVETGDVVVVELGVEPHDVKIDESDRTLWVADEDGRALLRLDPLDLSVLERVELPAPAHDLTVADGVAWVTLNGRSELARVEDGVVELHRTTGSPHDLIVAPDGRIWFSNWSSERLNVFDPLSGETSTAPAGVLEPHHFAIGPDGSVWVTDNGGSSIVGFRGSETTQIEVGSTPHHAVFVGDAIVVAVSGAGVAAVVRDGIATAVSLSEGLHGVAEVVLPPPQEG